MKPYPFPKTKQLHHNEQAVIMLLLVILLPVFVIFAAFAIDLTASSSHIQISRQQVKLAALAALEEYYDTEGDHAAKLQAALDKANAVSKMNLSLNFNRGASASDISSTAGESTAKLEPGRYYYTAPTEGTVSGCSTFPCFVPSLDDPNAFRITGVINSGYTPIFMKAFSSNEPRQTTVSATVSVVPRHGCFLVDLSPSITRETHQLGGQGSEFAFLLASDNDGFNSSRHDTDWARLVTDFPERGANPTIANKHYADDYALRTLISDDNFSSGADGYGNPVDYPEHHPNPEDHAEYSLPQQLNYRIDLFRNAQYSGPQPLTNVMKALNKTVDMFKERQVAGDMMCLIFYDNHLFWPRILKLTDDFDYIKEFTDWTKTGDPAEGLERALQHGIFPGRQTYTNMTMALSEAMRQLASVRSEAVPSSDFIAFIGDGLTNCASCPPTPDVNNDGALNSYDRTHILFCAEDHWYCKYYCQDRTTTTCKTYLGVSSTTCPAPQNLCLKDDVNGDGRRTTADSTEWLARYNVGCFITKPCDNALENYYFSVTELKKFVADNVFTSQIPVHVLMIGDSIDPHTLDVPDTENPSTCLSEAEVRAEGLPLVKGLADTFSCWGKTCTGKVTTNGVTTTVSDTTLRNAWYSTFYQVNVDMYDIARMTGGIWAPIRPQYPGCSLTTDPPPCGSTVGLDSKKRRIYDPYCRTVIEQIVEYIEEILGQNPYTIVDHY